MCFQPSVTSEGILVPDPYWKMQTNSYTTQMPVQQKGFAVHSRDKQVKTPNTGDTVLGKDVELIHLRTSGQTATKQHQEG